MKSLRRAWRFLRERASIRARESLQWRLSMSSAFRTSSKWEPECAATGIERRYFFPHRFYFLPKCGPDGYKLARRMCGAVDVNRLWQIVLFADSPALDEFPEELFFDNDLMWHGQQFNRTGQVATMTVSLEGRSLFTMAHHSDLVQRISRRREFKTRVEKVFKGWHRLMLNCIVTFAVEQGVDRLCVPTAPFAMKHTDQKRSVQPELFERVYDRAVNHQFQAVREGQWWSIDIAANRAARIVARRAADLIENQKTVCVCHDIERGFGYRTSPQWAQQADREAPAALDRMLSIERTVGVRATYNIVGEFLHEVRGGIEGDGHCVAFHSYDHEPKEQLERCRNVDYRIKGYRPPNSRLTSELTENNLCWYNFEWLASSAASFGFAEPRLNDRVVKIPVLFDDFDLHRGRQSFEQWHRMAIDAIMRRQFVAFSLHDCYAEHWLPYYENLLREISKLARLRTLDEVAADMFLAGAI
jgi:hypothetical protein